MKEIAPSSELRSWFGHDPARWPELQRRYREELRARPQEIAQLVDLSRRGDVTFVYGSGDEQHNAAVVLKEYVEEQQGAREAA
jgi:uncharacterized protein YeaO (DUF488 family)